MQTTFSPPSGSFCVFHWTESVTLRRLLAFFDAELERLTRLQFLVPFSQYSTESFFPRYNESSCKVACTHRTAFIQEMDPPRRKILHCPSPSRSGHGQNGTPRGMMAKHRSNRIGSQDQGCILICIFVARSGASRVMLLVLVSKVLA